MKTRTICPAAGFLVAIALAAPAQAFDVARAETEAEILVSAETRNLFIQFAVQADLAAVTPEPIFPEQIGEVDVLVGWEEVGGIDPTPFEVLIPAGCFVLSRGYEVQNPACGVQMTFYPDGRTPVSLSVAEFEARIIVTGERAETARFTMEALVTDDVLLPAVMGTLGGAPLEIAVGTAMGMAPILKTEAVSGVEPTPF